MVSTRVCPTTRPSADFTDTEVGHHPRSTGGKRLFLQVVQLSGGGGQRSPDDRGGVGQPTRLRILQQAAAMMEETQFDNVVAVPRESIRRMLGYYLGQGSRGALCSRPKPVRRAGAYPPRNGLGNLAQPGKARIPSHLSPRDKLRRKLHTSRSWATLRFADLARAVAQPGFGQIKQGRVHTKQFTADGDWRR